MDSGLTKKYQEAWNQYYVSIRKFCYYHLNGFSDLIDDCCQEIFQAYLEALIKNIKIVNTKAWLYKVANNITCRLKKQSEMELALVDDPDYSNMEVLHKDYDFLEEIIREKYTDGEIIKLISESLTEEEKFIFERCFLEQESSDVVADKLHITTNYLYKKKWTLKHKIEQRIQKTLDEIETVM